VIKILDEEYVRRAVVSLSAAAVAAVSGVASTTAIPNEKRRDHESSCGGGTTMDVDGQGTRASASANSRVRPRRVRPVRWQKKELPNH
jgi:hypothetical protein